MTSDSIAEMCKIVAKAETYAKEGDVYVLLPAESSFASMDITPMTSGYMLKNTIYLPDEKKIHIVTSDQKPVQKCRLLLAGWGDCAFFAEFAFKWLETAETVLE